MLRMVKMFRSVFVLRRIATSHVPAAHAEAQVDPTVAHLEALLAAVGVWLNVMYLAGVRAGLWHGVSSRRSV
jgi:hypothetical protein